MLSGMKWDFHHIPKALDECKEFGKQLREMPLIMRKALRIGRSKVARDAGAPASPWSLIYELRSCERGLLWSEKRSSRCSLFCDDPNAPESA